MFGDLRQNTEKPQQKGEKEIKEERKDERKTKIIFSLISMSMHCSVSCMQPSNFLILAPYYMKLTWVPFNKRFINVDLINVFVCQNCILVYIN